MRITEAFVGIMALAPSKSAEKLSSLEACKLVHYYLVDYEVNHLWLGQIHYSLPATVPVGCHTVTCVPIISPLIYNNNEICLKLEPPICMVNLMHP